MDHKLLNHFIGTVWVVQSVSSLCSDYLSDHRAGWTVSCLVKITWKMFRHADSQIKLGSSRAGNGSPHTCSLIHAHTPFSNRARAFQNLIENCFPLGKIPDLIFLVHLLLFLISEMDLHCASYNPEYRNLTYYLLAFCRSVV